MATSKPTPNIVTPTPSPVSTVSSNLNREVLLQAWAQISVYDRSASGLKSNFIRRRELIIWLTLTATVASVGAGIINQPTIALGLALMNIVLPIVGSYLMNDIVSFTGTTSWIKYRYIAEMMRMHIYLYRMNAGIYFATEPELRDDELSKQIRAVRDGVKMDEVIPPSVKEPNDEASIIETIKAANSSTPDDDGLSEIKIENYIKWRIDKQREWYDSRILDDFNKLKNRVRWAQGCLAAGAMASALVAAAVLPTPLATLVAITSAISVALTNLLNVSMTGKTYSLFQIASQQLADQKRDWSSFQNNPDFMKPETRPTKVADFVLTVENVLLWEREEWYELALQSQVLSDKMIQGDLTRLTQRAKDAQK